MQNNVKARIFFVDDQLCAKSVMSSVLGRINAEVESFCCGRDCLKRLHTADCDLLITDLKMPGMTGFELLKAAKRLSPTLPVLVITGYGDIPSAVKAIKMGASDFIEKPLERERFLSAVRTILEARDAEKAVVNGLLSDTELAILDLICDGKSNKEIALIRSRSVRTIEDHRKRIMDKLGVHNLLGLIRAAAAMGLFRIER